MILLITVELHKLHEAWLTVTLSVFFSSYTSHKQICPLREPVAMPLFSSEQQIHDILCDGARLPQNTNGTLIWMKDMLKKEVEEKLL